MKWIFSSIFGIIGLIFLVIGCPMLAGAAGLYYFLDTSTQNWVKVTGTVTALSADESYNSSSGSYTTTYCPTVEYNIGDETLRVDTNECSSPPMYNVGDPIELLYDPQSPRDIQIEGGVRDLVGNIFIIVFGILGVVFSLIGGGMALFAIVAAFWRGRKSTSAPL
jgi:hypothetical protein